MSENKLPIGWDSEKVQRVVAYYEGQNEDDALAEDLAAIECSSTTVEVPHDLLSEIRELIAKHQK